VWEGSFGFDSSQEAMYEFSVEIKSDFTNETPFRSYDAKKISQNACMVRTA
jgi:hypothetical protein